MGRPSNWNSATDSVRLPKHAIPACMALARQLDDPKPLEHVKNNVQNLPGQAAHNSRVLGDFPMVWFVQVLEIANPQGIGTGKFRLTAKSDDPVQGPFGLCEHEHESKDEAANCAEARANEGPVTGIPYQP